MAAYFLLRVGVKLEDEAIIADALNQYDWHIRYLQDPASGLWYHGYDHLADNHMSAVHWARANAWAAYTMSQVAGTAVMKDTEGYRGISRNWIQGWGQGLALACF